MDRRMILAYAAILLIVLVIAAAVGWMMYNGATGRGRRRVREENREHRDRTNRSIASTEDPPEHS